jgi:hypothetical protein
MNGGRAHVSEMFRWSMETRVEVAEILAAGLGMAGPLLVAAAIGHLQFGLAAAVGALSVSGAAPGSSARDDIQGLVLTLAPAAAAAVAGAMIAGHGWSTDAAMDVLACIAATIGGYSRPFAVATTRFILFLVVTVNIVGGLPDWAGFLISMAAGVLWTVLLTLIFNAWARVYRRRPPQAGAPKPPPASAAQKWARWKRTLAGLSGWQYTLRLAVCLGIASVLRSFWPEHHLYWIALTVALLLQRQVETVPVKATQRAAGTLLGVLAAGMFVVYRPPDWSLVVGIGVLAGLRPFLRARNYLAYSAIMTPLIILIMDAGQSPGVDVLTDRLIATLAGAALVITTNLIFVKFAAHSPAAIVSVATKPNVTAGPSVDPPPG